MKRLLSRSALLGLEVFLIGSVPLAAFAMSFLHDKVLSEPMPGRLSYEDLDEASFAAQLDEQAPSRLVIVSSEDGVMSVRVFASSPAAQRSLVLCADPAAGAFAQVRAEDYAGAAEGLQRPSAKSGFQEIYRAFIADSDVLMMQSARNTAAVGNFFDPAESRLAEGESGFIWFVRHDEKGAPQVRIRPAKAVYAGIANVMHTQDAGQFGEMFSYGVNASTMTHLSVSSDASDWRRIKLKFSSQKASALVDEAGGFGLHTNANFSSFLSARNIPGIRDYSENPGWHWELTPWSLQYSYGGVRASDASGGDAVLRALAVMGPDQEWVFKGYVTASHENLQNFYAAQSATSSLFGAGMSVRRDFAKNTHFRLRADYGYASAERSWSSTKADDDDPLALQYLYGEALLGAELPWGRLHAVGAELAGGWLKVEQLGAGSSEASDAKRLAGAFFAKTYWNSTFRLARMDWTTSAHLSATYLTDPSFASEFEYLNRRFGNYDEKNRLYARAGFGIGLERKYWSLKLDASQERSGEYAGYALSTSAQWRF